MLHHLEMISGTIRHIYWTLLLQGILFILLGVLIIVYPPTLFVLMAITFVMVGLLLLASAFKVYSFWKKLPGFLKK